LTTGRIAGGGGFFTGKS